jgi:anaerobic magnesium-protoporphyrin IX monomethyl ester cyclase
MPQPVTLIHTGISSTGFDSYGKSGSESSWISHGLCSIGACLKQAGHDVDLIDLRALAGWDGFDEEVRKRGARVYGIMMLSVDYDTAVEAANRIRGLLPDALIVTGGAHPTLMLDEVVSQPAFDHIVTREGEITFPQLLKNLESGLKQERVLTGESPDLDSLPFADRSLYPLLELPLPGFPEPFVTVIAGRGCMYNCSFCMPAEKLIFGKKVRKRSPENLISELEILRERHNFKSLMIHDDCILENREWVEEFCRLYREKKFDAVFSCQSRADLICKNPDMLQKMRDANLRQVFIGFESGSARVLKVLRKGVTVEQNIEAARICRKLGILIWANYMFGIPSETPEEMMETARMIRKIRPAWHSPAFFTPHPGSDLYDKCVKEGLSLITEHKQFSRNPTDEKIRGVDYDAARKAMVYAQFLPFHVWMWKKLMRWWTEKRRPS